MDPITETASPTSRATTGTPNTEIYQSSRLRRILIVLFGVGAFFFFLVLKLPDARIQNFAIAHMRILAQEAGLNFSAEKVRLGLLFGPSVRFYNVELKSLENEKHSLKIPYFRVRPKLFSFLGSTKKFSVSGEVLEGEFSGTVGANLSTSGAGGFLIDLSLDDLQIGSSTLIGKYFPLEISSGKITGVVELEMDYEQLQKTFGRIKLNIEKLGSPAQSVYGFNLPKLTVNETKIDISITSGQMLIREFELGKDPKKDDIVAKITGDGQIDKSLDRTRLNARIAFELSDQVKQNFPLLDSILAPAKTPDGKFSYKVSGPLYAPEVQPGG